MHKSKLTLYSLILLTILTLAGIYLKNQLKPGRSVFTSFPAKTPENIVIDQGYTTIFPAALNGYLLNPGMGWQKDNSKNSDYFPESVVYANRSDISWRTINPANGEYDWKPIDDQYFAATILGQQFSFRIFTMAGEEYGGHQVPQWVLNEGALILPSGEPDYSNCIYQQEWGRFVNALLERYDGQVNIAFIDISGYGDFNEWGWRDDQTEWDALWEKNYQNGKANSFEMQTVDGQTRRRLVDMFIGGAQESHRCRLSNGSLQTVSYSYEGAQKTQLVMPYAGIVQTSQYAYARRSDVGFRYDCLGREKKFSFDELNMDWKKAPVIYEFCGPDNFKTSFAQGIISNTHPILIHNNSYRGSLDDLQDLVGYIGYRFVLKEAGVDSLNKNPGDKISLSMLWENAGTSPSYPKMGQDFQLHAYLTRDHQALLDYPLRADISKWYPADPFSLDGAPIHRVDAIITLPVDLQAGIYSLRISIIEKRTNVPIQIAVEGVNADGSFPLFDIAVE